MVFAVCVALYAVARSEVFVRVRCIRRAAMRINVTVSIRGERFGSRTSFIGVRVVWFYMNNAPIA